MVYTPIFWYFGDSQTKACEEGELVFTVAARLSLKYLHFCNYL